MMFFYSVVLNYIFIFLFFSFVKNSYCENNESYVLSSVSFSGDKNITLRVENKTVRLLCSQFENKHVEVENIDYNFRTLTVKLIIPESCNIVDFSQLKTVRNDEGSVSFLTIFLIIIIILVLYFACGAFLKLMSGAQGIEIVPHHRFFTRVLVAIQNGILFCANGCQSTTSYDRI